MVLLRYLLSTILSVSMFMAVTVGMVGTQDTSSATVAGAVPATAMYIAGEGNGALVRAPVVCDLGVTVNISTATTTSIIAGAASQNTHICSMVLITNGANNVALIEGTGATCGTGTAGLAGGTTAASGFNFASNGGITWGSGLGQIMITATAADRVCIVTSAATQLSGYISYTQF